MKTKNKKAFKGRASSWPLHLMLLVPVILTVIYKYGPMLGLVMAFEDYIPSRKGFFYSLFQSSTWVGLDWFEYIFKMPDFFQILRNTIVIAVGKLAAKIICPLIFALLLNEVIHTKFKRFVQSVTFIPYFLSWVVLGSILLQIFSPRTGVVSNILSAFGIENFYLFGTPGLFQPALIATDLWKEIGYNTIIYLAALTSIDPGLYEAAAIDGAGRFRQVLHISIPSLMGMVLMLTLLGIGSIMSAGFDQVYMLYSPAVYSTGDIIDTYTFRMGIQGGQYSLAAAVGLFKSVVSFVLMLFANLLTSRLGNRSIL